MLGRRRVRRRRVRGSAVDCWEESFSVDEELEEMWRVEWRPGAVWEECGGAERERDEDASWKERAQEVRLWRVVVEQGRREDLLESGQEGSGDMGRGR